ncbi:ATP-dependent Clp protease ATP-binding protein [Ligilactobacillus agilis]|uniref:ATP-dependent Clp protease ATP-binding protein n=1 Tax=Ligilactobacillus agilis TaxID=1601 RepID=A0A6F9XP46_9LACO|nr:AAA family ATPase [Ligilactobacillus agilis]MDM8279165.1 AAA family ATPase [Ligilactobacillus agilis]GET06967.1 ATP-dependent Clp protease ATP-binding protein [Ligilactobacillus agilis]
MSKYLKPMLGVGQRKFVNRDNIVNLIQATLNRNEVSNVALLGDAGVGKTTIVMMAAEALADWEFYEVNVSLMSSGEDGSVQMASRLTKLFDEVQLYQKNNNKELVLFLDEFHAIMKISPAALEAIKPVLANSGRRGLRLIVATTYEEYDQYIRGNQALHERLEVIKVPELTSDETIGALGLYLKAYLPNERIDNSLLRRIVNITNKVQPSQSQPRKSVRLLDAVVGYHTTFGVPLSDQLLSKIVKASLGVNIDWQVNSGETEVYLNRRVFDQPVAVKSVVNRLYISSAELNDNTRPRGSFLFTGPTGVGKTELAKALATWVYGAEESMVRFDMSEYSNPDSVDLLRDRVTSALWQNPSCILLYDEIEKACKECSTLLLQVLDDARLTDRHGKEISFKDCFIIITTNVGADVYAELNRKYAENSSDFSINGAEALLKEYYPLIERELRDTENGFPAELLGRLDAISPFSAISFATRRKIADAQLKKLAKQVYDNHGVTLHFDKRVMEYIVREGVKTNDANSGGGRTLRRKIDQDITGKIAKALVNYKHVSDLAVIVEGKMAIESKFTIDVDSSAQIKVGAYTPK